MSKVSEILKEARKISDKKFARNLRMSVLDSLIKSADGILTNVKSTGLEHKEVERTFTGREHAPTPEKKPYEKVKLPERKINRSLSTRYSPDRVGVQAQRISDGVWQDPITKKIYDWNEGFTTETGDEFTGGSVALQTDLDNWK